VVQLEKVVSDDPIRAAVDAIRQWRYFTLPESHHTEYVDSVARLIDERARRLPICNKIVFLQDIVFSVALGLVEVAQRTVEPNQKLVRQPNPPVDLDKVSSVPSAYSGSIYLHPGDEWALNDWKRICREAFAKPPTGRKARWRTSQWRTSVQNALFTDVT
jgi:hypothetical protein